VCRNTEEGVLFCKILVNRWFRVDPVFLRRYNKNEYENLEVNAGKWTRIIVEVEPPARWIRKQKQLRFPQPFASFAESCGKAPLQRCRFPQNGRGRRGFVCAECGVCGIPAGKAARFLFPDLLRPPDTGAAPVP